MEPAGGGEYSEGGVNSSGMMAPVVPNLVKGNLLVLFVGINPGMRTASIGRHFAGHSNRFWKLLAVSGLTPYQLKAEQDAELLEMGFGITNIVARPTASAAELTGAEMKEGAGALKELVEYYRPKILACLGKDTYRYYGNKRDFDWGKQEGSVVDGVIEVVLPNPSGLNRMPFEEQVRYYRELKAMVEENKV